MLSKLISHSVIYAIGPQLPRLASLAVLPLITPYLTAQDYGVSATVWAWLGLLSGFKLLGFDIVLVRSFYARTQTWKLLWRQILGWLSVWSIVFSLVQALVLALVLPVEARDKLGLIVALTCLPSALLEPTAAVAGRLLQLSERPLYIASTSALTGIVGIALNYWTIAILKLGYIGWFASQAGTLVLQGCLYSFALYFQARLFPVFRIRWSTFRTQLRVSLPVIPHQYSSYLLTTSDRLVMDVVGVRLDAIGSYGLAYTLGSYLDMIGSAVGMAAGPQITKLWSSGTRGSVRQCRELVFVLQALFIGGSALVAIWAKEALQFLIRNQALADVYPLTIIIVMSFAYRPMYWSVVNKLIYAGKTNQLWKLSFVAGGANVVLNLLLIPVFGTMAAAATTFVALLYLGFAGFGLPAYRQLQDLKYYPLRWLALILLITLIVYSLRDAHAVLKVAFSLLTCVALLIVAARSYQFLKEEHA